MGEIMQQHQQIGFFIVSPNILMSHIEEVCEIALGIPLIYTSEEKINKSAFTTSMTTVVIDNAEPFLLIINCDDSFLDAAFEKNRMNVIEELSDIITSAVTRVFQHDPRFGFPTVPQSSSDGVIAQTFLTHTSGSIQILLTEIDNYPVSVIDF